MSDGTSKSSGTDRLNSFFGHCDASLLRRGGPSNLGKASSSSCVDYLGLAGGIISGIRSGGVVKGKGAPQAPYITPTEPNAPTRATTNQQTCCSTTTSPARCPLVRRSFILIGFLTLIFLGGGLRSGRGYHPIAYEFFDYYTTQALFPGQANKPRTF